jgi:hypothetical protein
MAHSQDTIVGVIIVWLLCGLVVFVVLALIVSLGIEGLVKGYKTDEERERELTTLNPGDPTYKTTAQLEAEWEEVKPGPRAQDFFKFCRAVATTG